MSQTLGELLRRAVAELQRGGDAEPRAAAEVLLADLLDLPRPSLFLDTHRVLSAPQRDAYAARLRRRLQGEPVQYIVGRQEFWSLSFIVNAAVLTPRPETELRVEHGLRHGRQWFARRGAAALALDVGAGSGNVAVSLAHSAPESRVWGIDVSGAALQVAAMKGAPMSMAAATTDPRLSSGRAIHRPSTSLALRPGTTSSTRGLSMSVISDT